MMSDIAEQARKNEALYKSLAQDAARGRLYAMADVNRFDKLNHSDAPRRDKGEMGLMLGASYSGGKWSVGITGPGNIRGDLADKAISYDNQHRLYTKLADLSHSGHIVSEDDFYKYQANHTSGSMVKDLWNNIFHGRNAELMHLDKYEKFIKQGGNIDEFMEARDLRGTEKEYMQHKKAGNLPEYMHKLENEEKLREIENKKEAERIKARKEEIDREIKKEEREEAKEAAKERKADKKISSSEDAVKEAVEGINKSGAQLASDTAISRPNVAVKQGQQNQIV